MIELSEKKGGGSGIVALWNHVRKFCMCSANKISGTHSLSGRFRFRRLGAERRRRPCVSEPTISALYRVLIFTLCRFLTLSIFVCLDFCSLWALVFDNFRPLPCLDLCTLPLMSLSLCGLVARPWLSRASLESDANNCAPLN